MFAVSDGFLETLAGPHRVATQLTVRRAGRTVYEGLPFVDGSVQVDVNSPVRRRLSLTVPPRLSTGLYTDVPAFPSSAADVLSAYGTEIHVQWGLVYTDDSIEWIPAGVFRVDSTSGSLTGGGSVSVEAVSRESYVVDAEFVAPRTLTSPSATSLIGQLIREVLPSAEVVVSARRDARVPTMSVERDRWGTIVSLAESIGAVVFCDGWGRFVVADAPSLDGAPVWVVRAGDGGALVSAGASTTRVGVHNAVIVQGENASGDVPPNYIVAYDDDPTSPTRWGDPMAGRFGQVPRFESYPNITSADQALAAAQGLLAQSTGAARTLDVSTVPNPALEGGDLIAVVPDPSKPAGGSVRAHIVDGFTIPLLAGGGFSISTREVREVIR